MENEENVLWQGMSSGLSSRMLGSIGLTGTLYKFTNDELIIKEGFFKRRTNIIKLSNLSNPKLVETLYQRLIKVGTIYLTKNDDGKVIALKNIKEPEESRQALEKIFNKI